MNSAVKYQSCGPASLCSEVVGVLFAKGVWFVVGKHYHSNTTTSLGGLCNSSYRPLKSNTRPQLSAGLPYFHVHVSETYILHIVHPAAAIVETEIYVPSLWSQLEAKEGSTAVIPYTVYRKNNGKVVLPNCSCSRDRDMSPVSGPS